MRFHEKKNLERPKSYTRYDDQEKLLLYFFGTVLKSINQALTYRAFLGDRNDYNSQNEINPTKTFENVSKTPHHTQKKNAENMYNSTNSTQQQQQLFA